MVMMVCEECGASISNTARICPKCGWQIGTPVSLKDQKQKAKELREFYNARGCFVVAFVVGGGITLAAFQAHPLLGFLVGLPTLALVVFFINEIANVGQKKKQNNSNTGNNSFTGLIPPPKSKLDVHSTEAERRKVKLIATILGICLVILFFYYYVFLT